MKTHVNTCAHTQRPVTAQTTHENMLLDSATCQIVYTYYTSGTQEEHKTSMDGGRETLQVAIGILLTGKASQTNKVHFSSVNYTLYSTIMFQWSPY